MVNRNEIYILFNLNPDGSEYDHASGVYRMWRKNRQPTPGSSQIGTDINRNFSYRWGSNPLNASPSGETYRGPTPWSTPGAAAFKRFVDSRVVAGKQRIRVHVTLHQYGRVVLYPYAYTKQAVPSDMDPDDHAVLVAMARQMAALSGYAYAQASRDEVLVGHQMDWLYVTYRIMSFTIEMGDRFYLPDEQIPAVTARNMDAVNYAIEQAGCPYATIGRTDARCRAPGNRPAPSNSPAASMPVAALQAVASPVRPTSSRPLGRPVVILPAPQPAVDRRIPQFP